MDAEIETNIKNGVKWEKIPRNLQEYMGMNAKAYDAAINDYSIKNQLRHRGNLVGKVRKNAEQYYTDLIEYSKENLMLYPYHLQDMIVKGLRMTAFQYYVGMVHRLIQQEKNYDSMPNFTAADCLRLLGIGRNEYIDIVTESRTGRRLFKRAKSIKEHLPSVPIDVRIDPWWIVQLGYVTEDDLKNVNTEERAVINTLMKSAGGKDAGSLHFRSVHSLYRKGLIYLDIPVSSQDAVFVPPLEGFVMNRLMGDYFETLLYKIFVSIDGLTSIGELSNILNIDVSNVEHAVAMFYRLGFVQKRSAEDAPVPLVHPSWTEEYRPPSNRTSMSPLSESKKAIQADDELLRELSDALKDSSIVTSGNQATIEGPTPCGTDPLTQVPSFVVMDMMSSSSSSQLSKRPKRTALLFDSTLTAILMMGNLSGGLKNHAVTMFEVGKLTDDSLDAFLTELDNISGVGEEEGEAERFFSFALNLRATLRFLRGPAAVDVGDGTSQLDLIRIESLQALDSETTVKLLAKNYSLLLSLAPLSCDMLPIPPTAIPHLGPPMTETNSVWMKMFIYWITSSGPPTLILPQGTRLRTLPKVISRYPSLQLTLGGHDPVVITTAYALNHLNEALPHSPVCIQGWLPSGVETRFLAFPFDSRKPSFIHSASEKLAEEIDLKHTCGYLTFVRLAEKGMFSGPPQKSFFNNSFQRVRSASGKTVSAAPTSLQNLRVKSASESESSSVIDDPEKADLLSTELDSIPVNGLVGGGDGAAAAPEKEDSVFRGPDPPIPSSVSEGGGVDSLETPSDWLLFDCSFGLPLMDKDLNAEVSQSIVSRGLGKPDNFEKLSRANEALCTRLRGFIERFTDGGESARIPDFMANKLPHGTLPPPTQSLLFSDGVLRLWDPRKEV